MTFDELKFEYREQRIGQEIYKLLRTLCWQVTRSYAAKFYAIPSDGTYVVPTGSGSGPTGRNTASLEWTEESIDDLLHETIEIHLLGKRQLDFIFDEATSLESVKRLFVRQIRRTDQSTPSWTHRSLGWPCKAACNRR